MHSTQQPYTRPILSVFCLVFLLSTLSGCDQFTPEDYVKTVKTGGPIEAKYLAEGEYAVESYELIAPKPLEKITFYYPSELKTSDKKYPVVVFVNGTGVLCSKYQALFRHLASWGFIAVGNEDPRTGTGASASQTLDLVLRENSRVDSPLYGKVDQENVGVTGHSQGGSGVFNAATNFENSAYYKAIVSLSPVNEELAAKAKVGYDPSKVKAPILIIDGNGDAFETKFVISPEQLHNTYDRITAPKARATRDKAGHGQTLFSADGYVTAWFMAKLQGDEYAAQAFEGDAPELLDNPLYQDQKIDLK